LFSRHSAKEHFLSDYRLSSTDLAVGHKLLDRPDAVVWTDAINPYAAVCTYLDEDPYFCNRQGKQAASARDVSAITHLCAIEMHTA
jgi:hypothetical protein